MSRLLFSWMVVAMLGVSTAWAHHTAAGRVHPTVTITRTVMADGKPLPPGKYDIWITEERPTTGAGAPSEGQRIVEFAQNEKVVAREIAEVFPRARREAVGTSGSAGKSTAQAQLLRGGEFVRVSVNDPEGRFLIHLPTGPLNGPAPQPQAPARLEKTIP